MALTPAQKALYKAKAGAVVKRKKNRKPSAGAKLAARLVADTDRDGN